MGILGQVELNLVERARCIICFNLLYLVYSFRMYMCVHSLGVCPMYVHVVIRRQLV